MKATSPMRFAIAAAALAAALGYAFVRVGSRYRAAEEDLHQKQIAAEVALALEQRLRAAVAAAYIPPAPLGRDGGSRAGTSATDSASPAFVDGWLVADQNGVRSLGLPLAASALEMVNAVVREPGGNRPGAVVGPLRAADGRPTVVILTLSELPTGRAAASPVPVGAALLAENLLSPAGLSQLPLRGLAYELSTADRRTGQRRVISRSSELGVTEPLTTARLADDWVLTISRPPRGAWFLRDHWIVAIVVLLLTLGAGLLAHDVSARRVHFREELARREQRLNLVNQRLMDEVQQRADIEQQFEHASFHDPVTGLPNRRYFANRVGRALHRLRRQPGTSVAVLVFGFDRFRQINDTFGFAVGDELLRQAAQRIEENIRPADLAPARIAGDEFAVIMQGLADADTVISLAERLQDVLARPFRLDNHEVFATTSVGISMRSTGYADADDLLGEADIALSSAKAAGRARHALFDSRAREEVVTLQQLETDLHRAIECDELRLHFQPIVSLETGRIAGLESLVRWDHPRQGIVMPGHFIRAAEALGMIVPINRWVLRQAVAQARAWHDRLPDGVEFYVSTNLSGHDLKEPDLCDFVDGLLRETGLPAGMLRLEVTESALIEDVKGATDLVAGLRRIGVPLLLDDFGTGYSSLSYLDRFRVDYVKIDQSFVRRVAPEGPDTRILTAILHLAEDLGMGTIAEGAERVDDVAMLQTLGCDFAQGYYFSKPVPAEKAEDLLKSGAFPLATPPAPDVSVRARSAARTRR